MATPRRALLAESDVVEQAAATAPRRSADKRALRTFVKPIGVTAPLAAVMALSVLTTASGATTQDTTATSTASAESTEEVASRVAARGTYTQTSQEAATTAAEEKQISRDTQRESVSTMTAEPLKSIGTRYTTAALNVRQTPVKSAKALTTLDEGSSVKITAATFGEYRQIIYKDNTAGWVLGSSLTKTKPTSETSSSESAASGSVSQAACSLGSSVESGLVANTVSIYRSVCANFPSITSYGGVRSDSLPYHPSGRALDIMTGDAAVGNQITAYLIAHSSEFNIDHIIYRQQLWVPGQGWSAMEDRGSATANHMDHVHVAVAS